MAVNKGKIKLKITVLIVNQNIKFEVRELYARNYTARFCSAQTVSCFIKQKSLESAFFRLLFFHIWRYNRAIPG